MNADQGEISATGSPNEPNASNSTSGGATPASGSSSFDPCARPGDHVTVTLTFELSWSALCVQLTPAAVTVALLDGEVQMNDVRAGTAQVILERVGIDELLKAADPTGPPVEPWPVGGTVAPSDPSKPPAQGSIMINLR